MYKIYINERALILTSTKKLPFKKITKKTLVAKYLGKKKFLFNYIDMLEKGGDFEKIVIYHDDIDVLKADFNSLFTKLKAGGGVVKNEFNEILFIFRKNTWDLPKGKKDKGEKLRACAIREVMEETGTVDLKIDRMLVVTRHLYKQKGQRILKYTKWYLMNTHKQKLIPQLAEDITKAKWMTSETFFSEPRKVYKNIGDVLASIEKKAL
jgi:8-oxo-dGTP pyrophosphatase MutT (NUDIX family)